MPEAFAQLRAAVAALWSGVRLNSLAFRLFAASAIWTALVLPATGTLLYSLYRQEVERIFDLRLDTAWWALISFSIEQGDAAPHAPAANAFGDQAFSVKFTGWYWQITPRDGVGKPLLSPSLQGEQLEFPLEGSVAVPGKPYRKAEGTGPQGEPLRMFSREITFGSGATAKRYTYIVTGNLAEVNVTVQSFRNALFLALSVLGLGLVAATLFQVRYGLRPLAAIGKGLADIRSGQAMRLEGELPSEIVPLQRELNALIKSNQDIIERARTHVGNLAHALKTPLSVITNEARGDQSPLARKVVEQAGIMRDQVQHHLDRARMVARSGTLGGVTEVKPVVEALARVLGRIHGERGLEVTAACPEGLRFQGEKQDLEEMLGNLLDNACKWAAGRVRTTVRLEPARERGGAGRLQIVVEDDGPGLAEAERQEARKRGKRLDETKPGSGLGLSIVTELVELYDGRFDLERAELGGLAARLTLPAA